MPSGNLGGYLGQDLAPAYRDKLAELKQETGLTYGKLLALGVDQLERHGVPDSFALDPKSDDRGDVEESETDRSGGQTVSSDSVGADFDGVGGGRGNGRVSGPDDGPEDDPARGEDDDNEGDSLPWYERPIF